MKTILFLLITLFLFVNCSSTKSYIIHKPISEVNIAIDSSMTKIGLDISEIDSFKMIDGPFNRNSKILLKDLDGNSTKLIFENPAFMGSLSDNYVNIYNFELSKNYNKNNDLKSKLNFSLFTIINTGWGWHYMSTNSIYWDSNSKYASIGLGLMDAALIYNAITQEDSFSVIFAIFYKINLLFWGNYFITYDNKVLKAGYNFEL